MATLGVNIDHIATIRQARLGVEPEPVTAAAICELAGADAITVHLREDRRHIQDRDVEILSKTIKTRLNLEMAATDEIQKIALRLKPYSCTLVPEKRQELTTEGGLDVVANFDHLKKFIAPLTDSGIIVSLFIDAEENQIQKSKDVGAQFIELHTGKYAEVFNTLSEQAEFDKLKRATEFAHSIGLRINAGHGLNYNNVVPVAHIPYMEELNIGHSIISKAVFTGLDAAVRDMKSLIS